MAGSASIFRIDATGDTEATARTANEIIEFNDGTNPDARSMLEAANNHWIEDISKHPNPKKALNRLQAGQLGTREMVLRGWFEDPDNALGMGRLSRWMKETKTAATLKPGRFGIRVDDLSDISDLTPSSAVGYILYDVEIDVPPDHPFEANFVLKLWLNGTHP